MRRARYDRKQVICPNASLIGDSTCIAKPGYWVAYTENGREYIGRVLGRIARTDSDGLENCKGFLAVVALGLESTCGFVRWVDPRTVTRVRRTPPAQFLAWITGAQWVSSAADIARIVAMSEHGTLSDSFIANRDDPEQAYNARPAYVAQFILGD